jgi:Endoplasmic Reticulum Oxidoreductin 1 (ERO1)
MSFGIVVPFFFGLIVIPCHHVLGFITSNLNPMARIIMNSPKYSTTTPVSWNEELLPGIQAIDSQNKELFGLLSKLKEQSYFRLYSVDMLGSCEYIPQELTECYSETCEVYPVDEDEVPQNIMQADRTEHDFEIDGWARWDMPTDDYYDTLAFPEDYTAYDGSEIWNFIHSKICFQGYDYDDDHWKADFNKAVSGVHSLVSAQVIRGIQDRIQTDKGFTPGEPWTDPVLEFERRLSPNGDTPLAIENLYFCYMLCLSAVNQARDRLLQDCDLGQIEASEDLRPLLELSLLKDNTSVEAASRKLHDHAVQDATSQLWEARMRTRELLRIMNCVQCNKCRFHGKIAMMGLSTALQILVGQTGEGGDAKRLHRVELAALMTTLYKFSRAVDTCQGFLSSSA